MSSYFAKHLYIHKVGGTYTHHGLGIGNGRVIHYSGLANDLSILNSGKEGEVETVSLEEFSQRQKVHIRYHEDSPFTDIEIVHRALSRLGEKQYHVLHNNCEHFVHWCISGKHKSKQARNAKLLYSAGIGMRALSGSRNPAGLVLGAAGAYAYVNYKGLKKRPDLNKLEEKFRDIQKNTVYL